MRYSKFRAFHLCFPRDKASPGIKQQRGLALMLAVVIVIIATTISVNIIHEGKFTIRKTAHIQSMDRASLYAFGLEDWARIYLIKDLEDSEIDSLDEDWALGIPGLPIEGGYLTGYIEDEQAKFNLNSVLTSELAVTRLRRLCDNLEIENRFIPALRDWIDEDFDVRYPDGAEEHYENYRVANRPMADISELLLVQHVTPEMFDLLKNHITALPVTATINVNTMSEVIFESLDQKASAAGFVEQREENPFTSLEDFVARLHLPIDIKGLSVDSNYFHAHGQVVQGESSFNLNSLIFRDKSGKTSVVSRNLGQF